MTISATLWDKLTYKHYPREIMEAREVLDRLDGDSASVLLETLDRAMTTDTRTYYEGQAQIDRIANLMRIDRDKLVSFWFIMTDYDVWED